MKASRPSLSIIEVMRDCKLVVLVPDRQIRVVVEVAEFNLAPSNHRVRSVPVVIVAQGAVVHHGGQVWVLVL